MFSKANDIVIEFPYKPKNVANNNYWVVNEDFDKHLTKQLKLKKGCEEYGQAVYKDKCVLIGNL